MPAKPAFSDAQIRLLRETVKKHRKRFKNQTEMALALGLTQPSLSALLNGKWKPGITTADAIAHLEQVMLVDLIGPYGKADEVSEEISSMSATYPNLEACIRFYNGTRNWAAWTIAAARAGFWGEKDVAPPAWADKLDALERALERLRKEGK